MATVHPSRMGLVPQDPPRRDNDSFRRPPSPNRRSRSPERRRGRSGSPKGNDDARRDHGTGDRRPSPSYDKYRGRSRSRSRSAERGPAPNAPWRQAGSMYPPRDGRGREPLPHMQGPPQGFGQDRGRGPHGGSGGGPRPGPNDHYGGGGSAWLESRRQQRAATTLSIWPKSPERGRDDRDDNRHRSSKKRSKRRRSPSSDSDSSDSDRDRKRRKDKKRSRHSKSDKSDHKKSHSSHHKHRHSDEESEESDSDNRRRHKHDRSRSRSRTPRRANSPHRQNKPDEEDDWVEKPASALLSTTAPSTSKFVAAAANDSTIDDDADEPGPQLPAGAMAAFLQGEDGTRTRIPRRGEIGLLPDQIEQYENVGYVMSGSRHRRMNAVRMRKENQVISAEEKRAVLKLQKEERSAGRLFYSRSSRSSSRISSRLRPLDRGSELRGLTMHAT
ncbi:ras-induced vulval development antagonist-domain-containing protein [Auriculariales sp. MPI-PUGE-AT-0066]|nr:ras-induced vulval development antagonist-domain-containing protein [Auriculariales sp. MPI-PUGE-AT-0066]